MEKDFGVGVKMKGDGVLGRGLLQNRKEVKGLGRPR